MPATSSLVASTTTSLTANQTWTSPAPTILTGASSHLVGTAFANVAGTLFVEQSPDGTFWDVSSQFAVPAGAGIGWDVGVVAPYARLRYVNGAAAQTTFRLYAFRLHDTTAYVIRGT